MFTYHDPSLFSKFHYTDFTDILNTKSSFHCLMYRIEFFDL